MSKLARVLTLAVVSVLAIGGGAGIGRAATKTVTIDSTLHPTTLTIQPGDAVTWVNADSERHRMRSREGPVEWDSNDIEPGEHYTFTFTVSGTYPYLDERDDENTAYHGTIVVASSGGGSGGGGGAGGGTGGGGGGAVQAPSSAAVRIVDKTFTPGTVTIATGGTVSWSNDDDQSHTVNASAGGFASGTLSPGGKYSRTFTAAGTFGYFCAIHPDMKGSVRVQTASGTVPPPKPATGGTSAAAQAAAPVPVAKPGQSGVSIVDFAFTPPTVSVKAGDAVVWANRGAAPHTVTAKDGSFESGMIQPGSTFRRVFAKEGTYAYVCSFHPNMTGTVLVGSAAAAAASPATTEASPAATASGAAAPALRPAQEKSSSLGVGAVLGIVLGIPSLLFVGATVLLRRV